MVINIAFIVIFFVEMLMSYIFFGSLSNRKLSLTKTLCIGLALFEFGAIINIFLISNAWLNASYSIFANFLFSLLCFDIKRIRGFFYSVLLIAISTILEVISVFIFPTGNEVYLPDDIKLVFEISISKIIFFFIIMLILQFIHEGNKKVRIPVIFFVYPVTSTIATISFWYISTKEFVEYSNQIILAVVSVLLFVSTIFMFFAFQLNAQKENRIFMLQQEQNKIETDKTYYDILEQQNNNLREYAHDARKHISAIKSLNNDPEIDSYISKLIESLDEYSNVSHSGNRILDVIIDKYVAECKINNINFSFDINNNNLIGLEYNDIVSILGNLLDNAVEAALSSEKKYIAFETDFRNNYSVVIISNSCDIQPKFDSNKTPLTTKPNKALHGFGLKSVKKTIKKYAGDISLEYNENNKLFIVTVMLYLK